MNIKMKSLTKVGKAIIKIKNATIWHMLFQFTRSKFDFDTLWTLTNEPSDHFGIASYTWPYDKGIITSMFFLR